MIYQSIVFLVAAVVGGGTVSGAAEPIGRSYYVDAASRIVRGLDRDGDGQLSREEWAAMATARPTSDPTGMLTAVNGIFDLYDFNRDHFVTADELATQYLYSFDCLDLNHDGRLSDEEASHGIEGRCDPQNPRSTR